MASCWPGIEFAEVVEDGGCFEVRVDECAQNHTSR